MNILKTFSSISILLLTIFFAGCTSQSPTTKGVTESAQKSTLNDRSRGAYVTALSELEKKNYDEASNILNRIMAENPGFAEGWGNLSLSYFSAGNIKMATQALNNALQLDLQSAPLYNLAGLIAVEEGSYKDAEQRYAQALKLNPNLANTHYNLALLNDIYYLDIRKAIQHYERYLALINNADADTEAWVQELKRNLK